MSGMVTFACADGKAGRGYERLVGDGRPGVVVLHEWWGLTDQICGAADRFARAGFNVLAPDLYDGSVATDPARASALMATLDFAAVTDSVLTGAARHLAWHSTRVAVVGYSLGGALSAVAATRPGDFAAAVDFYGLPDDGVSGDCRIPFQGHFADRDDWCTAARVADYAASVRNAELHRYDAAHAFCNERGASYDAACTELAWQRMSAFLAAQLG